MGEKLCSVLLPVAYEHDPMCIGNIVWDADVGMSKIALVWTEWLFELPGVSGIVSILV